MALEPLCQNETGLYLGLVSKRYLLVPITINTRKWLYNPHHWQFLWMFQPSPQLRNVEKAGLQLQCISTCLYLVDCWSHTFVMLNYKLPRPQLAPRINSFVTQHLLTWEPGIPLLSKWNQRLFGAGFYLNKCSSICYSVHNELQSTGIYGVMVIFSNTPILYIVYTVEPLTFWDQLYFCPQLS